MTTTTESENVMPVITVQISANALSDYLGRLYESDDGVFHIHIDIPGANLTVTKSGKRSSKIELTEESYQDWIDDLDYQIEFAEGAPAYTAQCRRALATLKEAK